MSSPTCALVGRVQAHSRALAAIRAVEHGAIGLWSALGDSGGARAGQLNHAADPRLLFALIEEAQAQPRQIVAEAAAGVYGEAMKAGAEDRACYPENHYPRLAHA